MDRGRVESLGPAERIITALLTHTDHMVHNRPGIVVPDRGRPIGVRWEPAAWRKEGSTKRVYRLVKPGRAKKGRAWKGRPDRELVGDLHADGTVRDQGRVVGQFRDPGLFPEVAAFLYQQVADVYAMDNAFAAHWASWAFPREHRDLKVVLAAFMLVQDRAGEPVREGTEVLFHDDDFRAVGEAMCLIRRRDGKDLNPKLLLRVAQLLELDVIARINQRMGFGASSRRAFLGRWPKAVERWLRHREHNPRMLEGLVRAGYRTTTIELARRAGYKPRSPAFFQILRWKQKQGHHGRRTLALGAEVAPAESWEGLTETEIVERIHDTRPGYKRLVALVPPAIGLTAPIVGAAVQAGCLSDTDLILLTPTLEDLGLLDVPAIGERWMAATEAAEDLRAAKVAERVKGRATADRLQAAADNALKKAVEEVSRGLRVYVAVDVSASMSSAIERAKTYLTTFLQGFPNDRLVVAIFNTNARRVPIPHASAKGVEHAFKGVRASGGTTHGSAFRDVFRHHPPGDDEDALVLFVGDQQEHGDFAAEVVRAGIGPVAFGFLHVPGSMGDKHTAVQSTAARLGIPCFPIDEGMFGDSYAVTRTLRRLIASTPVSRTDAARVDGTRRRGNLIEEILDTPLLTRPIWA